MCPHATTYLAAAYCYISSVLMICMCPQEQEQAEAMSLNPHPPRSVVPAPPSSSSAVASLSVRQKKKMKKKTHTPIYPSVLIPYICVGILALPALRVCWTLLYSICIQYSVFNMYVS